MAQNTVPARSTMASAFLKKIATCQTSYDILRLTREFAKDYGFEYFSIGRLPGPDDQKLSSVATILNWPAEMIAKYDEDGLIAKSPMTLAMRKSIKAVIFSDVKKCAKDGDPAGAQYYNLWERFGVIEGITVPVQSASGQRGVVAFFGSRDRPVEDEIMEISYFANLINERLVEILRTEKHKDQPLSQRERECLQWTAGGKTSQEIAMILSLSEHTVNHYLSSACQKLNAANRAHAVAKAIRSGLLD